MHCKYLPLSLYKPLEKFSKALYGTKGGTYSARIFRPVMCKTKANLNLVTGVFPRFTQGAWFYFEFPLVHGDSTLVLIGFCDYLGFGFRLSIENCSIKLNSE